MAELGNFALLLGLFLSSYAILFDLLGVWRKDHAIKSSARNATIACLLCLTTAVIVLWIQLIGSDFGIRYVADYTSRDLPLAYKISALWAGASGSLLFWLWLQVMFTVFVFCRLKKDGEDFAGSARAILNLVCVFFMLILIRDKNPFAFSAIMPSDGQGLNPLLQHPAMALHPPLLFIGYAACAIPFAWVFGYLKYRGESGEVPFLKSAQKWILWSWMFLTVGIVLGAWWAYEELGWGGYWAWDPVENSSLMPWLTATALLHCSRTYRRDSAIEKWFIGLALATFSLCVFGTFLTRYGLVSSIHAFPDPGLGILFLILLIHIWVLAGILIVKKWRFQTCQNATKSADTDTPAQDGRRFIIWNNWLIIFLTFVVLVGTLFPFFSGLFTVEKITLKPSYFTKITAPIGLALLLLLSVCPYLFRYGLGKSWRTITALAVVAAALIAWLLIPNPAPAYFIACGFALAQLLVDIFSKRTHLRRYGALIAHMGVVLMFIGIAGSGGYDTQKDVALKPQEATQVAGFNIVFDGLSEVQKENFVAMTANISVYKEKTLITKMQPSIAFYFKPETRSSEVDIRRTLAYDLYFALTEVDNNSHLINLNILVKPLINWVWLGSIIAVIGSGVVLFSIYTKKVG
jgi:cytochrome c-type biogenesis protein CcmF